MNLIQCLDYLLHLSQILQVQPNTAIINDKKLSNVKIMQKVYYA